MLINAGSKNVKETEGEAMEVTVLRKKILTPDEYLSEVTFGTVCESEEQPGRPR